MSNYNYGAEFNLKDIRLREKQCKCKHTCWKCPLCGLFKDNVLDIQQAHIEALESLLDINDKLLSDLGIVHISLKDIDLNVIISTMIEQKKRQFYSERKGLLLEE